MKTLVITTAVGITAAAAGFTLGYYVAIKRTKEALDDVVNELEASYRDSLARFTKSGPYSTPEGAAAILIPAKDEENQLDLSDKAVFKDEYDDVEPRPVVGSVPLEDDEEPSDEENETVDVSEFIENFKNRSSEYGGVTFPGQVDDINSDADIPIASVPDFVINRDPNGPYIISIDDYMEDDSPFTKLEMTYFEGDETLIDSREQIVPDIDGIVGLKNIDKWGTGTTDPNQVYIRNERIEADIEVTRDDNTYSRVVLGIIPEEELQRSMQKPLKMRENDE